jgi:CheY-like chemotaxis protein/anti-sigma regulatory factor (Ser/Thr protein kinase)
MLEADASRLSQVLSNLLSNAANYTSSGGRIELRTAELEGEVVMSVSDTGRGIPADMHQRIFEMFTQIPADDQPLRSGLGIGLTLVKRLVELHRGSVSVESAGPNQGSRFTVRLPGIRAADSIINNLPQNSTRPSPAHGTQCRVLIVDDNEAALETLCMIVQVLGHDIERARDGLEAITAAESFRPDIILMDIGMPRLDGYQAARRIRSHSWGQTALLVATTGWGQEEDRRRSKEAGFDHHFVKPVDIAQLKQLFADFKPRGAGGVQSVPCEGVEMNLEVATTAANGHAQSKARSEPAADALLSH